jgi:glycosyltransferase involved in cell wall biosynthesis
MMSSLRIVVTGLITQHPGLGGITWHYLQYVLGLARLGHDVYYLEDSGEYPYDPATRTTGPHAAALNCEKHVAHLASTLSRYGLSDRWAYRFPVDASWFGLSDRHRREVVRTADLLINVSGSLVEPEAYREIPRLAYVDTDPVVTQAKIALGRSSFPERVAAHDVHFSFGEAMGEDIPPTPQRWLSTRQPVVLSEWEPSSVSRDAFTTVMSWTSYEPVEYAGRVYGQKDIEFQRFLDLPRRVKGRPLEIALGGVAHPRWEGETPTGVTEERPYTAEETLRRTGWNVVPAEKVCGDLDRYRDYIRSSRAEWSVAKNAYVAGRPGWFSERSACYLASGRPVVVQDTGFASVLPVGEGLLSFADPDEAVDAIEEVDGHYSRHSRAARDIAREYFDSDRVLSRLVSLAMTGESGDQGESP